VLRAWMEGQARITGFLEDCAHLADALLTVYEASGEARFFAMAIKLCEQIVARFRDSDGAYYDTANDAEPLIVRPRTIDDNPVAAGQSVAARAFARLHAFTGDDQWRERALEIIRPLAPMIERAPLGLASLAMALQRLEETPCEIAVSGDVRDERTLDLVGTAWQPLAPVRVVAWGPEDGVPLLRGRHLVDGAPAAYVCEGFVCRAPVTSVDELRAALEDMVTKGPVLAGT